MYLRGGSYIFGGYRIVQGASDILGVRYSKGGSDILGGDDIFQRGSDIAEGIP